MQQQPPPECWQDIAHRMESITDRLGQPIDPGIFETVVALTALGVETTASCEGHLDHGLAAPWIAFQVPGTSVIHEQVQEITIHLRQATEEQQAQAIITDLQSQLFQLARDVQFQCGRGLWPVHQALEALYKERQVTYDQQLFLRSDSYGHSQLHHHGSDFQPLRADEDRAIHLARYQQEMQLFGSFLKTDYLLYPSTTVVSPVPLSPSHR